MQVSVLYALLRLLEVQLSSGVAVQNKRLRINRDDEEVQTMVSKIRLEGSE